MARCRKCNAFILFASENGLCKKCAKNKADPSAVAEKPAVKAPANLAESVKEPDPYEHYGANIKIFHFEKPHAGNLAEINRWLKQYSFSYLMIKKHNEVTGTFTDIKKGVKVADYCFITDLELECVKEIGKELHSYQIAAYAFDSKGKEEDEKTEEQYKQKALNKYPGAAVIYTSRCTYASGKCSLIILVCSPKN